MLLTANNQPTLTSINQPIRTRTNHTPEALHPTLNPTECHPPPNHTEPNTRNPNTWTNTTSTSNPPNLTLKLTHNNNNTTFPHNINHNTRLTDHSRINRTPTVPMLKNPCKLIINPGLKQRHPKGLMIDCF